MKYIKIRNVTSLLFFLATIFFLSNEANAQWTQVESYNHYTQPMVTVGKNVFAGFTGYNGTHAGVFRSTDNGDTWSAIDSGLVKKPGDTLNVISLAATGDTIVAGTDSDGIFISTNNGDSWEQINNEIADSSGSLDRVGRLNIMAVGTNDSKIYAAVYGIGVFVSNDAGKNWKLINNGLPLNYLGGLAYIEANEFDFVGSYMYLICPLGGTFVSTDGGANWTNIFGDTTSFSGNCFVSMGNIIFLGRSNSGGTPLYNLPQNILLRSTINGKSWTDISAPFEKIVKGSGIHAFAIYKNNLIVGSDEGVYISSDSGNTWASLNTGWDYKVIQVNSLALNNNYIFAGTNSEGIWRIPLSEVVTGIEKTTETLPANYSLLQNYPNPFNPTTVISYQLSAFSYVKLDVYNVLGQKVAELVNKEQPAGTYKVTFNGNNLSSGIYLYKLQAKNYTSVKKMILLK